MWSGLGDPLSDKIFNLVVDTFLLKWVSMAAEAEGDAVPGFCRDVHRMVAQFYTDDDLLAPMRAARLQRKFQVLMELFDRLILCNNMGKAVSIICQPCITIG